MSNEATFTGHVPVCPHCQKPTRRTGGSTTRTLAYFPPVFDEQGNNTNPDRNTETQHWECLNCGKSYSIAGNTTDGYRY